MNNYKLFKRKYYKYILLSSILYLFSSLLFAFGELNIEITKGVQGAIPVAIVDFGGEAAKVQGKLLADVIAKDLQLSGQFKTLDSKLFTQHPHNPGQVNYSYWRKLSAQNVLLGKIEPNEQGNFNVKFSLLDIYRKKNKTIKATKKANAAVSINVDYNNIPEKKLRALAHRISDKVYENILGVKGVFSTRIAYVLVTEKNKRRHYYLEVSDSDGFRPQTLLSSNQPIMSPSWSPDGKKIAYVSFENLRSEIYVASLATGKRESIAHFKRINGAPSWSTDGKKLALVLSKDGAPNIYLLDLATKKLSRLTGGYSQDTEPKFMPDGKHILFTSNRGNTVQVYQVNIKTKKISRLTFNGVYNARPAITPDGKGLVTMHRKRNSKNFNIALQKLGEDRVKLLTKGFLDESPSISPNGKMILYATSDGRRGVLSAVSIDGRVHLKLPVRDGSVQEPAWSPFLS